MHNARIYARKVVEWLGISVLGHGILLYLATIEIFPDRYVASMITTVVAAPAWAHWIMAALFGLLGTFLLEMLFWNRRVSLVAPLPVVTGKEEINSTVSDAVISTIDSPFASRWPLAQKVIDYVAVSVAISPQEACLVLQRRMLDGSIKARGPLNSASASEIDCEFWRFALPDKEGKAVNISTLISLPWFEVCANDVFAIWPENRRAAR
jgi:hypothetical protein